MTDTEFLGNSISLESAMTASGRKQPLDTPENLCFERPLLVKADARRFRGNATRGFVEQVSNRQVPVHPFPGVPLGAAGTGVNSAVEEFSIQPLVDIVFANCWK